MKIKIINMSDNPLPAYETSGSAGMDLRASLTEPVKLKPLQRTMIPTGLFMEIPKGYEAQVRPRSGLAIKKGLSLLNTPGTIDSDYRGEIQIILINLSNETAQVHHGERIAQMVIVPVVHADFEIVEDFISSERGAGGFGHTGRH